MNLAISFRSELQKTRRTAVRYLCILVAAIVPVIFLLNLLLEGTAAGKQHKNPWNDYIRESFQISSVMFFPLFVILLCTLVVQVEYRNNTWKQVFSSPQSLWHIITSKLLVLHLMVFFFMFSFNVLLLSAMVLVGLFLPHLNLFSHSIDWNQLLQYNITSYLLVIGMLSIQFWLSMRLRNFIAPLGIGLALWFIGGLLTLDMHWSYADRFPHGLSWLAISKELGTMVTKAKWWSAGYAVLFFFIAVLDLQLRKAKA